MILNLIGPFVVNAPFGTEIAFAKGLRQAGHEVIEVDPNVDREMIGIRNDADATVVFKSCCGAEPYLRSLTHPIVVYQPDDARFPHIKQMMLMMRGYADLFLSFDHHGANVAKTMGYRAAETLLLTADPELYSPSPDRTQERDIDVSFIGSIGSPTAHASRWRMLNRIKILAKEFGWKTHFEVSQDIPHVVDVYRRSKVVVNHATDVGQPFGTGFGLQCRHFEVGMTATCLLSNSLLDWNDRTPQLRFLTFTADDLEEMLVQTIMERRYTQAAADLYQDIMAGHMPVDRAKQLVDFIERNG